MITRSQCRAARGLLGWTQQELASAADISKTAIINFERGTGDIKRDTLRQIRHAFESQKVQFGDMDCVRRRAEQSSILEGPDKLFEILRKASIEANNGDGEILISFLNEQEILKRNLESFYEITQTWEKNGTKVRYLLGNGEFLFLQPSAEYRWVPEDLGNYGVTTIIYGPFVALRFWNSDSYVVIESPEIARLEKARFETIWRLGKIPPVRMAGENRTDTPRTGVNE